jgi:hypothetical protein
LSEEGARSSPTSSSRGRGTGSLPLAAEIVRQHMDAYLAHEGLATELTAVDFFVG